jgi:hypothetical protein
MGRRREQSTDPRVQLVLSLYRIHNAPVLTEIPPDLAELLPSENLVSLFGQPQTPQSIITNASLDLESRYNLVSWLLGHLKSDDLSASDARCYAFLILKSFCFLLFADFPTLDPTVPLIFVHSLRQSWAMLPLS